MTANYHTHTWRCGHAEGGEQDYVQQAVKAGLKTLGFSDHTPYDFFDFGPRDRPMRMKPEELAEYAASIRRLAEKYRSQIRIFAGVEAEYYPKYFPRLLEMLRENHIQYMILGQHFLGSEVGEPYSGRPCADVKVLERYVSQTIEALDTGLFTYIAHPDLIHFVGSDSVYEREMRKLCQAAKRTGTPLEINLLGIRENRHYPNERFWQIAAEEGSTVLLGSDAHTPQDVVDPRSEQKALSLVERLGLDLKCELNLHALCAETDIVAGLI